MYNFSILEKVSDSLSVMITFLSYYNCHVMFQHRCMAKCSIYCW